MTGAARHGLAFAAHAAGRRNVAYLAFTLALVPLASALDRVGSRGLNGDAGGLAAIMLWGIVSAPFVLANAALLLHALFSPRADGRPVQALLACVLPVVVAVVVMD